MLQACGPGCSQDLVAAAPASFSDPRIANHFVLYVSVACNPTRAVTLPNIGVPHYRGLKWRRVLSCLLFLLLENEPYVPDEGLGLMV